MHIKPMQKTYPNHVETAPMTKAMQEPQQNYSQSMPKSYRGKEQPTQTIPKTYKYCKNDLFQDLGKAVAEKKEFF